MQQLTPTQRKESEEGMMGEIEELLTEIIKEQLEQCKENKTVPSREVLDTIYLLNRI